MRLLVLGISSLALGACSFNGGGYGYGANHTGHSQSGSYGVWQGAGYGTTGGCSLDPCAAAQAQAVSYQSSYQPGYATGYPAPSYTPPVAHIPTYPAPTYPTPSYPAPTCQVNPCSGGTYAVSPYAQQGYAQQGGYSAQHYASQPVAYGAQTPSAHAYGAQTSAYNRGWGYNPGTIPPQGRPFGVGPGASIFGHYGQAANGRNRRGPLQFYQPNSGYKYVSVGAAEFTNDSSRESLALQGRVGYQSDTIFGAELEASIGLDKDEVSFTAGGLDFGSTNGIKSSLAGFATVRSPGFLSHRIQSYARLGYHRTAYDSTVTSFGTTVDTDETIDGLAIGYGVEVGLTDTDIIRLDHTRYADGNEEHSDAVSLSYLRRF